jgi:hypothetical protein
MDGASLQSMRSLLVALPLVLAQCGPPAPIQASYPGRTGEPAQDAAYGEVVGVDHVAPSDALASGVRVRLGGSEGPVVVDLAPDWYLDQNGLRYSPNERLKVEGRRSKSDVIYARSVTQGGRTVELRDAEGRPLWKSETAR